MGLGSLMGAGLALIALEVLLTASQKSTSGAAQLAGLFAVPGRLAQGWMDPSRPLIPQKAAASTSSTSASSTGTSTLVSAL